MRDAIRALPLFLFAILTCVTARLVAAADPPRAAYTVASSLPPAADSVTSSPPPVVWPIDPPIMVTSSFGEFRRGHFHGGIDFSTQQAVGREVRAISDGWVWRVRASGAGYGRALYFRMDDGRTAVFAHLNAFAPAIQAFVEAAQESLSRYEVDLNPGRGRLSFRRGDLIAWSGESGAGPPHLHFEIRSGDEANLGLNPLIHGFAVPDSIRPIISSVTFHPYGAGATVDRSTAPRTYAAVGGPAAFHLREQPHITGAALLTVRALDPAGNGNRLAPFSVSLAADGTLLHEFRLERFDWEKAQEVELAYDFVRARAGDDYVLKLYRPIGASNVVFDPPQAVTDGRGAAVEPPLSGLISNRGEPALSPGGHRAEVVATDAAGNAAHLEFSFDLYPVAETALVVDRSPAAVVAGNAAEWPLTWTVRTGALDVSLKKATGRNPAKAVGSNPAEESWVTLRTPLGSRTASLTTGGELPGQASLAIPEGIYTPLILRADLAGGGGKRTAFTDTLDVAVVTRGPAAVLRSGSLRLDAPARAFFGPGVIRFSRIRPGAAPGLESLGDAVSLQTDVVPDKALTVHLPVPVGAAREKLGVYRLTDEGEWTWIGDRADAGGLSGDTRYLTAFGLFRDIAPPVVGAIRPTPGRVVSTRPEIFAGVDDKGSGFTWREIEVTIDGVPQIVVYDPESGTLRGRSRRELAPGAHALVVTVHDQAGNVTVKTVSFRVR